MKRTSPALKGAGVFVGATLALAIPLLAALHWNLHGAILYGFSPLFAFGWVMASAVVGDFMTFSCSVTVLAICFSVLINGAIGSVLGVLWSAGSQEPAAASLGWRQRLLLWGWYAFPVILPYLFVAWYAPFDQTVSVKIFGCGCHFGFNDNAINEMLRSSVLMVSLGVIITQASRHVTRRRRLVHFLGATTIVFLVSHFLCRLIWL